MASFKGWDSAACRSTIRRSTAGVAAARRFFEKAMRENGAPTKIAMDKSGANRVAIDEINGGTTVPITVRQVKYLNNIVEQDHRAIKRVTRPMLGFKSFRATGNVLAGVELMYMDRADSKCTSAKPLWTGAHNLAFPKAEDDSLVSIRSL